MGHYGCLGMVCLCVVSFICPNKNTASDVNVVHNVMLETFKYVLDVLNYNNIEYVECTFLGLCSVCHAKEALDISRRDITNEELLKAWIVYMTSSNVDNGE